MRCLTVQRIYTLEVCEFERNNENNKKNYIKKQHFFQPLFRIPKAYPEIPWVMFEDEEQQERRNDVYQANHDESFHECIPGKDSVGAP